MIRYSPEFKQSLVEMHNQGRSYTELAAEYGPSADSMLKMKSATLLIIRGIWSAWIKLT
ncbi:hypothetical protein [Weissella confusa]